MAIESVINTLLATTQGNLLQEKTFANHIDDFALRRNICNFYYCINNSIDT